MNQHLLSRISIVLLAIVLFSFGIYHFVYPDTLIGFLPNFLPPGKIWIYIPGIAFILAAISFITNIQVRLAAYLLAAMLFIFVLTIHVPNYFSLGDIDLKLQTLQNILKDTAIAAFALHIGANATRRTEV